MTTKAPTDPFEAKRVAKHSAKETIISIVIAFALAFVFRGFVVEAYVIPTGSMAPTLMGQHMRFTGETGYTWPMGPVEYYNNNPQTPAPLQGSRENPLVVRDPVTGPARESRYERTRGSTSPSPRAMYDRQVSREPIRGGDRIFVMKYLYSIYDPSRYDVVVFKNPRSPTENYIKRLIGLPSEQIALVDGDVFVRSAPAGYPVGPQLAAGEQSPWTQDGWKIARKTGRVEDTLWQLVHDSSYTPLNVVRDGKKWNAPWLPNALRINSKDWDLLGESHPRGVYAYTGTAPTSLVWDAATWPITDSYAYNDQSRSRAGGRPRPNGEYPVADLAVRMTVKPGKADAAISTTITSLGHEFKGEVRGDVARVLMRELMSGETAMASDEGWKVLNEATLGAPLSTEQFTRFEFRHVDQSLELLIEGERVAYGEYDWSPAERLVRATGRTVQQVMEDGDLGVLATSANYVGVGLRIEMDSGPTQLANVAVLRDVFYRPDMHPMGARAGLPGSGTHPRYTLTLGPDQFFVCGDNSPDSLDGRLWGDPDPWTAAIDPSPSVVTRRLMIGKAFFVYFPAPGRTPALNLPMPDFGRLRWIF